MTDWNHFFAIVEQRRQHWSVSPNSRFLWIYECLLMNRERIERSWWQHQCTNSLNLYKAIIDQTMPENDWEDPKEVINSLGLTPTFHRVYVELTVTRAFLKLPAAKKAA